MEERGRILCRREPDKYAKARRFGEPLCDKWPADGRGAGIDGLVDQGRRPPEVREIAEGDIFGIRAGKVELGDEGCMIGF